MGSTGAMGMAAAVNDGSVTLEAAIQWHLTCNHYPPLPLLLVPVALRVIAKARKGEWDSRVRLPKHIAFKGLTLVPVNTLVLSLHLEEFINDEN